jgi:hypothetical protein
MASHKNVVATKSVAKKLEAKLWQELAKKINSMTNGPYN